MNVGNYELEIDLNKTHRLYSELKTVSQTCICENCKNIDTVILGNYEEYHSELMMFGIEINKSPEIFELFRSDDGISHCLGIYHIIGKILNKSDCWTDNSTFSELNENELISFKYGKFGFTNKQTLVEPEIQDEFFQMELLIDLPYILDGKSES